MLNLIMNGFEAMKDNEGKRILQIRSMMKGDDQVCVCVCDMGPGFRGDMDPQTIFQPFFSTKDDGMGMGLSISRSIIEAMGGKLWAVNNENRGATFHFTLPAVV